MSDFDVAGQWVGYNEGNPVGDIILDLDPIGSEARGIAYIFLLENYADEIPCSSLSVRFPRYSREGTFNGPVTHFDGRIGYVFRKGEAKQHFPSAELPSSADVTYSVNQNDIMSVSWKSDTGTYGTASLRRSRSDKGSTIHVNQSVRFWRDFKSYVSQLDPANIIYRGQKEPYPLQTTFHRTNRKDMVRYLGNDVAALHRALSSRTKHFFDLDRPPQMGAFLNLAQHHGFPTPLLDWSYSPYVAAYFAFSGVSANSATGSVRIFCLDRNALVTQTFQFQHLTYTFPHLSILEALALENDRAVPQQGLLTLTNLQDIEGYLAVIEARIGKQILTVVDLPKSEYLEVMADLRLMGITRSSLFPGIESICLDTRDRLFS